jgi:hypothetical protein
MTLQDYKEAILSEIKKQGLYHLASLVRLEETILQINLTHPTMSDTYMAIYYDRAKSHGFDLHLVQGRHNGGNGILYIGFLKEKQHFEYDEALFQELISSIKLMFTQHFDSWKYMYAFKTGSVYKSLSEFREDLITHFGEYDIYGVDNIKYIDSSVYFDIKLSNKNTIRVVKDWTSLLNYRIFLHFDSCEILIGNTSYIDADSFINKYITTKLIRERKLKQLML